MILQMILMMKLICKFCVFLNKFLKNKNKGFSLIEVIIGLSLFSIFFISILFSFSSLIKLEIKAKQKIYKEIKATNEISKKYYILQDE